MLHALGQSARGLASVVLPDLMGTSAASPSASPAATAAAGPAAGGQKRSRDSFEVRPPTTWTVLHHDGPNHHGL